MDTEHLFAAGYNIANPVDLEMIMNEFDTKIGIDQLVAVHANDAKVEFGSGIDRHENIGKGHIGIDGFQAIMSDPSFQDVPFFLEVPGFESNGPDKKNLDILKNIRRNVR